MENFLFVLLLVDYRRYLFLLIGPSSYFGFTRQERNHLERPFQAVVAQPVFLHYCLSSFLEINLLQ